MRIRRKSDRLQGSDGTRLIVAMPAGPDPPRVAIKTHIDRQLPSLWPLPRFVCAARRGPTTFAPRV